MLDRNHDEPHPRSASTLKTLLSYHQLVDVWREHFPKVKQYTWVRSSVNIFSAARLDRIYVQKSHRVSFCQSNIVPTFLSDHHYFSVSFPLAQRFPRSSHWVFNNRLLQDHYFVGSFTSISGRPGESKVSYPSLSQWWDVGKKQVHIFCLQYTANKSSELKRQIRTIEKGIMDLSSGEGLNAVEVLERKKMFLRNLCEERGHGAMVRARFTQQNNMELPTTFFFGLEKRKAEKKLITNITLPGGRLTTDAREIVSHALSFYQDLYTAEAFDTSAKGDLLKDVPRLSEEDQSTLEQPQRTD